MCQISKDRLEQLVLLLSKRSQAPQQVPEIFPFIHVREDKEDKRRLYITETKDMGELKAIIYSEENQYSTLFRCVKNVWATPFLPARPVRPIL